MSLKDIRITAALQSLEAVEAAGDLMKDYRKQHPGIDVPLPSDYWALLQVSQIYATLATMSTAVGAIAGDYLAERTEQERLAGAMVNRPKPEDRP